MKIVYFGSPRFSAKLLKTISEDFEILAVVTQRKKPVGRGLKLRSTAVAQLAQSLKFKTFEVGSKNDLLNKDLLSFLEKSDFALVYAFGFIIPEDLLVLPKFGFLNVHPSLLPKFRGPSPVVYPLALGESSTGVSIIKMDSLMDHGPLIFQERVSISEDDFVEELVIKLTRISAQFLVMLPYKGLDNLKFIEQNHAFATYTRLLNREDGYLPQSVFEALEKLDNIKFCSIFVPDFLRDYMKNYNQSLGDNYSLFSLFRALYPWPGLYTYVGRQKKRLKIIEVTKENQITKVQLEGKPVVAVENIGKYLSNFQ
ncbi:MAG: hypothetical protein KatS3mg090_0629 [Patescibacteria group bacterium]|nr:MAG: hypothetical protein KatS3mg090_0629 [Patescibacteria group bacterium]